MLRGCAKTYRRRPLFVVVVSWNHKIEIHHRSKLYGIPFLKLTNIILFVLFFPLVIGLSGPYHSSRSTLPSAAAAAASPPQPPSSHSSSKIEFVDFWGTQISTREIMDATNTRVAHHIPVVETLDLYDGPLPPGAYLLDGKPQFDPKRTCRISLNVHLKSPNSNSMDPMEMVRYLQSCIDAGFQTFELQEQMSQSMNLMATMRRNTPSYVETHWSLRYQVPTCLSSSTGLPLQKEIRRSIVSLLQQQQKQQHGKIGNDAIDSLQLQCHHPTTTAPYYTLDTLDYLMDLQREGLIRSIGLQAYPSQPQHQQTHKKEHQWTRWLLRQIQTAGLGHAIDFIKQPGNLLLPPSQFLNYYQDSGNHAVNNNDNNDDENAGSNPHWWIEDALAGTLLMASLTHPQQMNRKDGDRLREWATRWEQYQTVANSRSHESSSSSSVSPNSQFSVSKLWQDYQKQVVDTLQWIGLKYRVPPAAVALRWALEKGSSHHDPFNNRDGGTYPPIVSTVMMDCSMNTADTSFVGGGDWCPVDWRKVFRFQLDEEDLTLLQDIPAPSWEAITRRKEQRSLLSSSSWSSSVPDKNNIRGNNPEDALNDWERELLEYQRGVEENKVCSSMGDYPEIDFHNKALWL
jgi:hypothetical protein